MGCSSHFQWRKLIKKQAGLCEQHILKTDHSKIISFLSFWENGRKYEKPENPERRRQERNEMNDKDQMIY